MSLAELLDSYRQAGYLLSPPKEVKSGKEATLFAVEHDGRTLALKVYADPAERAFKRTESYLEGRWYRKPSERKAVAKKNRFAKTMLFEKWVQREYYLLKQLHERGVRVPEPIAIVDHSILMEFLGTDLTPAPRLIDIQLDTSTAERVLAELLDAVRTMRGLGIVHSDLSPYNLLWWRNTAYIIDLPQAVDIRSNLNSTELLRRDLKNLLIYFAKYTQVDEPAVLASFDLR